MNKYTWIEFRSEDEVVMGVSGLMALPIYCWRSSQISIEDCYRGLLSTWHGCLCLESGRCGYTSVFQTLRKLDTECYKYKVKRHMVKIRLIFLILGTVKSRSSLLTNTCLMYCDNLGVSSLFLHHWEHRIDFPYRRSAEVSPIAKQSVVPCRSRTSHCFPFGIITFTVQNFLGLIDRIRSVIEIIIQPE